MTVVSLDMAYRLYGAFVVKQCFAPCSTSFATITPPKNGNKSPFAPRGADNCIDPRGARPVSATVAPACLYSVGQHWTRTMMHNPHRQQGSEMGDHSPYGTEGHAIRRFPPPRTEERMMTSRHILIELITIFKSPVAAKRLQGPDRLSPTAKGLSIACAQVQRSSSCACWSADLRSARDTIWRAHYLSGTA
jgi:hypothetical protein